ncbi:MULTISPECIES: DEAD/DEAH box helicase family protein [unclassified Anaeromyxobacter]|uniref:DEAD/DEAH box helicase family protein n=1 Tax=unclassified Anaeromyxobacter TaxID=2620896 RepID=UPI001F580B4B|nr:MULTISPECIES: DEAD/DEAH box helicase family protein [unclassified Anaeromyxobacter]
MIDISAAEALLDFSAKIGPGQRAREQLEGAVALHNVLEQRRVAYLADEVGMGKTYVALGALALFRHFNPGFRVLVIAPRENIQQKWTKELRNFVANNVRYPDLRVKAVDGRPARPLVTCENLIGFVREVAIDPDRDFFLRLTSFSLPLAGEGERASSDAAWRLRGDLRAHLPWLRDEVFDLRKSEFKDNFARALCCGLPTFDLVIVDEAHNLKHGFKDNVAFRNRVLGLTFGHPGGKADPALFPEYRRRAQRVLFLSATPVEETYEHLWNQLHVFGLGKGYEVLRDPSAGEEEKKECARQFLVRRVTSIQVGAEELTKNLYRREWRRGGVAVHDDPIRVQDDRQRLVLALVQKKVAEILGNERFGSSYQVGMLASFESFLETTRVKRADDERANFDDTDQTEDALEREGIDVADVNRIARDHRKRFGRELPHPKMDALVDRLASAWTTGEKALVFVRRVASVTELKRKLDERYDAWVLERLRRELPPDALPRFESIVERYRRERLDSIGRAAESTKSDVEDPDAPETHDEGGQDTFFAWFFRGKGPSGVVSGANIQRRFIQKTSAYSTFFEDNHVAALLHCRPGEVASRLAGALKITPERLATELRARSTRFLSRAKRVERGDRFEAIQAAAVEWLKDAADGELRERARIVWHERFETSAWTRHADLAPELGDTLETPTFFTELRARPELRERLWPSSRLSEWRDAFREEQLRAQLLASAARLGHAFIDLYVLAIQRVGSLDARVQDRDDEGGSADLDRITVYLDLLDRQRTTLPGAAAFGAFHELSATSENFGLVLDTNAPDARTSPLQATAKLFGALLRQQQPVGGMSGQVNKTLVSQFRMPGYPLVLVTTDLLQEGEDLHTFCSSVHHYGISWTPSSMEQRIGRIDRVRSQTDRRLSAVSAINDDEKLQVYFPHLEDTVEVLQVRRVLERMNAFMRLMHEGLTNAGREERAIDTGRELVRSRRPVEQIRQKLQSAFRVEPHHLRGHRSVLDIDEEGAAALERRFDSLRDLLPAVAVAWEPTVSRGVLMGTAQLATRVQPFTLLLQSVRDRGVVRCVSPVGHVSLDDALGRVQDLVAYHRLRVGAVVSEDETSYTLTVEDDVLLPEDGAHDAQRVSELVRRVVERADLLELELLPGRDERLETFRADLAKEGARDR